MIQSPQNPQLDTLRQAVEKLSAEVVARSGRIEAGHSAWVEPENRVVTLCPFPTTRSESDEPAGHARTNRNAPSWSPVSPVIFAGAIGLFTSCAKTTWRPSPAFRPQRAPSRV